MITRTKVAGLLLAGHAAFRCHTMHVATSQLHCPCGWEVPQLGLNIAKYSTWKSQNWGALQEVQATDT